MAIQKWDPFKELTSLKTQMDKIFESLLGESEDIKSGSWVPPVDIYETENEIVIKAEVPGVTLNDIEIKLEDDTLVIRGEKKFERDMEKETYHRAERVYGKFQRSFVIPKTIDKEKIKASLKHGVLTIVLPKKEEVKPKEITIQVEEE
ncbi:HSP20 family protein [Thermosulfidibacter takaii ABI70S6]|uniref:HSP20 family protein n=1 Tax=Thermosulfidibacter takaii (strain DSM 17441 / JCM 13301 / NBRC 103674 / ABI70S6) TaxID=1298851 RepID=A0A0S3QUL2_THET7|nr:Hsp20/alpha crystallin family protein [Thermosulfidibacter takaii]BAT72011.1 HSP20 family protein [Thermosulfidibacter takaii ABI70S6]